MQELGFPFNPICVQEGWLSVNEDNSQLQLKGYECISQGKKSSSKASLIIYLDAKFNYTYTKKLIGYKTWEGQVIQVKKGEHLAKPFTIGNIYRLIRELVENYTEFINEFTPILVGLEKIKNEVIITGDFKCSPFENK